MGVQDFLKSGNGRLDQQLLFTAEIDKMTDILRQTMLISGNRRENDAEHSWHLAMLAMILEEYSSQKVDIERVLKITLVHDLVEVYAGDTFAYDAKGNEDKLDREIEAANRLFGMLDPVQGAEIRALWDEFEAKETAESRYANAVDRLQPLLLNYMTNGHTWKLGDVHATQIYKRMDIIRTATPELWHIVEGIINTSIQAGILKP